MAPVVYGSRVFQYHPRKEWKESWLSVEENGMVNWKRKDAYLPLSSVHLSQILDRIQIGDIVGKGGPLIMSIPVKPNGKKVKFAFSNGTDLEFWLNAFAKVLNLAPNFQTMKTIKAEDIGRKMSIGGETIDQTGSNEILGSFYKELWKDLMGMKKGNSIDHESYKKRGVSSLSKIEDTQFRETRVNWKLENGSSEESTEESFHALEDTIAKKAQSTLDMEQKAPMNGKSQSSTLLMEIRHANGKEIPPIGDDSDRIFTVIRIEKYSNQCSCQEGNGPCVVRL